MINLIILLTNFNFILTNLFLFGLFYFFILCFILFMILVFKAPEYIENEDGSMCRVMQKKTIGKL
jgi:hypothetical protein